MADIIKFPVLSERLARMQRAVPDETIDRRMDADMGLASPRMPEQDYARSLRDDGFQFYTVASENGDMHCIAVRKAPLYVVHSVHDEGMVVKATLHAEFPLPSGQKDVDPAHALVLNNPRDAPANYTLVNEGGPLVAVYHAPLQGSVQDRIGLIEQSGLEARLMWGQLSAHRFPNVVLRNLPVPLQAYVTD